MNEKFNEKIKNYKLFGIGIVPFMASLCILSLIVIAAYEILFV
jgi:hypothetical protein